MLRPITIELFGHLLVRYGEEETTRFRTQKTATLLAYLAFYSRRPHPREELIDLLWPDVDVEAGRTSLRTALAALRRQLEPATTAEESDLLLADRLTVRLDSQHIQVDVSRFEELLQAAARQEKPGEKIETLRHAVAVYRGPLLPGWYDDWVLRERHRLEQLQIGALSTQTHLLESAGRIEEALPLAQRWAEMDPLTEEAHLALVRLQAEMGRLPEARRQFREWQRIAREELGETPSPAARALLERLPEFSPGVSQTPTTRNVAVPAVSLAPTPPAYLPLQLTRFFGRESEIRQLSDWLVSGETRLLTITGPGGAGKTRLAQEVASRLAAEWESAVWFVPLAELTETKQLPGALAEALRLQLSPATDPLQQIVDSLPGGPLLLVLDNFEQLPESAATFVQELLTHVASLRCLITSRVPLSLQGEQVFPLAPLPSPGEQDAANEPETLLQFAGVRMFLDRARLVRPDFQLTTTNAAQIAALCRKLEGSPLAIELTAAWAQALTPGQMLERLNRRFDLLTSRRKDLPERHRTLRATIEWSYRLLAPELQTLFTRLTLFRGGWTLEAAETLSLRPDEKPTAPTSILDQLSRLCEHSLILAEEQPEGMRYRMLETLREYGLDQLSATERQRLERRHRDLFLQFAEEVEPALEGPEQVYWLDRLEQEHDNLRAALRFSRQAGEWEAALRLAGALNEFRHRRGYGRESLEWLETLVAESRDVPPRVMARALAALATTRFLFQQIDRVLALYEQSVALYEQVGDLSGMARVLVRMHAAVISHLQDVPRARALLERSLALAQKADDQKRVAETLISLASLERDQGDSAAADAHYAQSIALHRQIGDRNGVAHALFEIGYMATQHGDYARADETLQEALAISREQNNRLFIGHILWLLARVREMQRDLPASRRLLEEARPIAHGSGDRQQLFNIITNLGIVTDQEGDYAAACAYFEESLGIARSLGNRWIAAYALANIASVRLKLRQFAEAYRSCQQSLTLLWGDVAVGSLAECLLMTAQIAAWTDQPASAVRLFGAGERLRERLNVPLTPSQRADLAPALERCRTTLGEETYLRLLAEGRAMPRQESRELALNIEPLSQKNNFL